MCLSCDCAPLASCGRFQGLRIPVPDFCGLSFSVLLPRGMLTTAESESPLFDYLRGFRCTTKAAEVASRATQAPQSNPEQRGPSARQKQKWMTSCVVDSTCGCFPSALVLSVGGSQASQIFFRMKKTACGTCCLESLIITSAVWCSNEVCAMMSGAMWLRRVILLWIFSLLARRRWPG